MAPSFSDFLNDIFTRRVNLLERSEQMRWPMVEAGSVTIEGRRDAWHAAVGNATPSQLEDIDVALRKKETSEYHRWEAEERRREEARYENERSFARAERRRLGLDR